MNKSNSHSNTRRKKIHSKKEQKLQEKNKNALIKEINLDKPKIVKPAMLSLQDVLMDNSSDGSPGRKSPYDLLK